MVIHENAKSVHLKARKNTVLSISSVEVYKENYYPFCMISPHKNTEKRQQVPGLLNVIITLTPATQKLFVDELLVNMDIETGVVKMKAWEKLNKSKLRSIYYKIAELKKVDLLLDYTQQGEEPGRFIYIINPYHVKPRGYLMAQTLWNSLGGKKL